MNVICLEEEAFYELVEQVVERLSQKHQAPVHRWIDGEEAMRRLRIKSTTLQKLRDEGKIAYSQPSKKIILYDSHSIDEYIEQNVKSKF
ncbi:helix-turn-helix domain-containing protein [Flavivirga aquimarina]|uniref:Helix-turn-helix domain-containing protein n=1 Tax=Flavivirga aquimarina TaxID=2027862 RepID=A0ABT8WB03_9FLAO|nr:helix-turn-helix domain-containing protein [Flavivirga aquimarina]MDO5970308.1 helix-turn-helix domain-containing protein [Flavivirga aquimarina]